MTDANSDAEREQADQIARLDKERARYEEIARVEDRVRDEVRTRAENAPQPDNLLTEEEQAAIEQRAEIEAWDLLRLLARYRRDVAGRTEEELIAEAPPNPQIRQPLELTRRLIDSNKSLQAELAASRESSERLTAALSDQITELTSELKKFSASSDALAGRILWWSRAVAALTILLILGTGILVYLTVVLVQRTP